MKINFNNSKVTRIASEKSPRKRQRFGKKDKPLANRHLETKNVLNEENSQNELPGKEEHGS